MCAGQFEMIENDDPTSKVPMRVFFRKSKRENINAAELFRVVKEGINFYEKFIGVKYPWQKYD